MASRMSIDERIELFGTIERDDADLVVGLVKNQFSAHPAVVVLTLPLRRGENHSSRSSPCRAALHSSTSLDLLHEARRRRIHLGDDLFGLLAGDRIEQQVLLLRFRQERSSFRTASKAARSIFTRSAGTCLATMNGRPSSPEASRMSRMSFCSWRRGEIVHEGNALRHVGRPLRRKPHQRVDLVIDDPVLRHRGPGAAIAFQLAALEREPLLVAAGITGDLPHRRMKHLPQDGAVDVGVGALGGVADQKLLALHHLVPGLDAARAPTRSRCGCRAGACRSTGSSENLHLDGVRPRGFPG